MRIYVERFSARSALIEKFKELPKKIYPHPLPEKHNDEAQYWLAVDEHENAIARLSTQQVQLFSVPGFSGLVSQFEATDSQGGVLLLKEAAAASTEEGAKRVLGPINGSAWQNFSLALPQKNQPPFFWGEPRNPPEYADYFIKAGFIPVATYESRITSHLTQREQAAKKIQARLERLGIVIKTFNTQEFESNLQALYRISIETFSRKRFYSDISFDAFRDTYERMDYLSDPKFNFLAYDSNGKEIGFLISYPDKYSNNLILKTMAVCERMQNHGLGTYLFDLIHLSAHKYGIKQVIHALMPSDNVCLRLSKEFYLSLPYRHYALYDWLNLPI